MMDAKKPDTGSIDAISNLPDGVLCHILSFLSTKESALTSVLSKRWRNLFAFVPNLAFDDSVRLRPNRSKRERDSLVGSFVDFVDRTLTLQGNSPIKKFSLKCGKGVKRASVNRWIHNVLKRGVADLDLHVTLGSGYSLPKEVFMSQTLVKLKVGTGFSFDVPVEDLFFPMLKTLVLDSVEFDNDGLGFGELFDCPLLEELVVNDLEWDFWDSCSVSSPTLKRLTIRCKESYGRSPESVSFDTPNLVYLEYSDVVAGKYVGINLDSLVEARLDLRLTEDQIVDARAVQIYWFEDDEENDIPGDATDFIMGMSSIQILHLSSDAVEVLSFCCEGMPLFNNLVHLSIGSDEERGWQSLPIILKNSPNLETLIFEGLQHFVTEGCGDVCRCISQANESSCLSSCPVKVLKIMKFGGNVLEMRQIEHFLMELPSLEELIIHYDMEDEDHLLEVSKELQLLPRASSECKFKVVSASLCLSYSLPSSLFSKWTVVMKNEDGNHCQLYSRTVQI